MGILHIILNIFGIACIIVALTQLNRTRDEKSTNCFLDKGKNIQNDDDSERRPLLDPSLIE